MFAFNIKVLWLDVDVLSLSLLCRNIIINISFHVMKPFCDGLKMCLEERLNFFHSFTLSRSFVPRNVGDKIMQQKAKKMKINLSLSSPSLPHIFLCWNNKISWDVYKERNSSCKLRLTIFLAVIIIILVVILDFFKFKI